MNKYIVTLTGFSKDPDLEQYCSYVEEMKGTIAKNLSEETNVLVVHETCTEKYKIAKLYKSPIDCVTIGWLIDSRKKNKLLPTRNYSIPSIFYNVVVGVLGFTPEKADKLKKIVEINGGKAHELTAVEQINEWAAKEDTLNLIITTRGQFDRIKHSLKEYTFTFVEIDWLEDSIRTKICKFPSDYAMNLGNLNPKPLIAYTKKLTKKLKECLAL